MSEPGSAFEPARYLSKLSGKDYLEVKWRLVWLRDRHPNATVDTELVSLKDDKAVFKAVVEIPGQGRASGYGSETAGDFRDFLEKAETKAIGRALAALGFGTQFCPDHDFGAESGRVVDSPVTRPTRQPARGGEAGELASDRQIRYLEAVARGAGLDHEALKAQAKARYTVEHLAQMTKLQASQLIDLIQRKDLAKVGSAPERAASQQAGYPVPEEPEHMRSEPGNDRHSR